MPWKFISLLLSRVLNCNSVGGPSSITMVGQVRHEPWVVPKRKHWNGARGHLTPHLPHPPEHILHLPCRSSGFGSGESRVTGVAHSIGAIDSSSLLLGEMSSHCFAAKRGAFLAGCLMHMAAVKKEVTCPPAPVNIWPHVLLPPRVQYELVMPLDGPSKAVGLRDDCSWGADTHAGPLCNS